MADGKVIIEIDADSEKLEKVLNVMKSEAANTAKSIGDAVSSAGKKISKFGTSMTKYLTTPVLAAGVAAVKFASDYEENLNKVDASFKDSAQVVKDWAKTATEQFGMSESAALEATSLFGDMGTSMGLTTAQAADMSTNLAGLAGDLASFKNIGIDQAMTALKGVFTGETESLKELGVVMTETNLKEFAKGLGLVYNEMSQTERVTLRYKYVLDKTKNAQGDYARTADGTANSFRTLKSSVENLGAAFGQEILPTITPLIQGATDLIQKFGELDEETKQNIIQAGLFAAATGPVLSVGGKLTDGLGTLIAKSGELRANLAGGTGLGSALLSTLGATGKAGLAVAGTVALAGGIYALVTKIRDAHDPVLQLQNAIDGVNTAQASLSASQNIIDLANRYEDLRAKMSDTSLSASELSSVESELDGVRAQLSSATGGAVSAEGDYNSALDETVAIQKTLAEIERERAKQKIYDYLTEGANDYKYALEELEQKEADLEEAEAQRSASSKAQTEGADQAYQGLLDTVDEVQSKLDEGLIDTSTAEGTQEMQKALKMLEDEVNSLITTGEKVHFDSFAEASAYIEDMDYSTQGAADSVKDAQAKINELNGEISDLKGETTGYDNVLRSLIDSGLISAEEAAGFLGMSVEELNEHLEQCGNTTDGATGSTEDLGDAAGNTGDQLNDEAQAAKAANDAIMNVAYAAVDAKNAGGDLRSTYEELSSELDALREGGDQRLIQLAEEQLAYLNLAATNQELAETYPGIVSAADAAGYSITTLSGWLIENGLTADEWGGRVQDAANGVMNGFQELDTSLDMSLSQMASNLQDNITAYSNWNTNIQTLMAAAVATGNQSAIDFVNYMQSMGVGAATQVAAMVEDIDWTMQTFAPMMEQATQAGMVSVYNEVEGGKVTAAEAASGMMEDVAAAIGETDLSGATSTAMSAIPQTITAQAPAVQAAATSLAMTAHSAMSQVGWAELGGAIGTGISGGITGQTATVQTAAQTLANTVNTTWTSNAGKFQQSGFAAGTQLKIGLLRQQSSVRTAAQSLAGTVTTAWSQSAASFRSAGTSAASSIAVGISSGSGGISSAASSAAYSAYGAVSGLSWYSLGYNISAGIADGVRGGSYLITRAARAAASATLSSAKSALGVHSPSRVFRDEIGQMIPAGMALGIQQATPKAEQALELSADQLLRATQIALRPSGDLVPAQSITTNNAYYGGGNGGGNLELTVSPVLEVDGREFARATAKYTGRQMAYLGGF